MTESSPTIFMKPNSDDLSGKLETPPLELSCAVHANGLQRLDSFKEKLKASKDTEFLKALAANKRLNSFLTAVFDLSPYLADLAEQYVGTVERCYTKGFHEALDTALETVTKLYDDDDVELMRELRHAKRRAALICGLADLGGWWSAAEVSKQITRTADITLQTAVNFLLKDANEKGRINLPNPDKPEIGSGYTVIAMGKHGAGELNYSSDIDIIVFFDPDVPAIHDREESVTLFTRMTKSLVRIMQDRTENGYVFRTDLRLRPDPGSMPLAIPYDVAMNYYESRGQNWERAAMIKARVAAGDMVVGKAILSELTPFIWRRYLDYAAIADVHSIKRQIQTHRGYTALQVPGHNVKLGRGGIREIEFFVQTQQLIAGGRIPALRSKETIKTLNTLAELDWIEDKTRDELSQSYYFLRDVEHRIQMIADAQSHTLPENEDDLLVVAKMCGFDEVVDFSTTMTMHLERVEKHYAALFSDAPQLSQDSGNLSFTGDDDDPGTVATLSEMGFERPSNIISIVRSWHFGRYPAMQTAGARERLTELTPALLKALAHEGQGDEALLAFDEFLKGLPRGFQLFTLLHANPNLLSLLVRILGSAPRLAKVITRRPHVFDGLLEPGFFDAAPCIKQFHEGLNRSLKEARDYEDGLNRARIYAEEQRFLIGIRVLSQTLKPDAAGLAYSDLAEVMLQAMVDWVKAPFEEAHGVVPASHFTFIAMGNFGTRELTASSDLDLMMLYEYDPDQDESNGNKPLHASQYFGRFAQRLIAAMGAPTSDGVIYEMDFRLRPSGSSGPIATSLRAFDNYYSGSAWTWEFMALTRARSLVGDEAFISKVNETIVTHLKSKANDPSLAKDILEMRLLMDEERPAKDIWDVKLAKGGLIDIEFFAQWVVLLGKANSGVSAGVVLSSLTGFGSVNDVQTLAEAHKNFTSRLQLLRLCLDKSVSLSEGPKGLIELVLSMQGMPDLATAEASLREVESAVRKVFLERLQSGS